MSCVVVSFGSSSRSVSVLPSLCRRQFTPKSVLLFEVRLKMSNCNSRQFDVNSTFYSIRSTTLSTPFEYNTVQEILTNKQVSLSVTLKLLKYP